MHCGSITFWVDENAVSTWCNKGEPKGRGRPRIYIDSAIECTLIVKAVFHLSLRTTQGVPALEAVVLTEQGRVIPLNTSLALYAADLALEHQLSFADAIIYSIARQLSVPLITSDDVVKIPEKSGSKRYWNSQDRNYFPF